VRQACWKMPTHSSRMRRDHAPRRDGDRRLLSALDSRALRDLPEIDPGAVTPLRVLRNTS
jgi:hypothetical protein